MTFTTRGWMGGGGGRRSLWNRLETIYGISSVMSQFWCTDPIFLLYSCFRPKWFWRVLKNTVSLSGTKACHGPCNSFPNISSSLRKWSSISSPIQTDFFPHFPFLFISSLGNSFGTNCHLLGKHTVLLICCKGSTLGVNIIHSCLIYFIFSQALEFIAYQKYISFSLGLGLCKAWHGFST